MTYNSIDNTKNTRANENFFNISHNVINANTPLQWFIQVVDEFDISKDCGNGPRHINSQYPKWSVGYDPNRKNGAIIDHINDLIKHKHGEPIFSKLPNVWTRKNIKDHCAGNVTMYFSGSSYWKQPYSLVMLDVDCKKKGTKEGAQAFLTFLTQNYFPGLVSEVSTNGNGGHGYLLINKEGKNNDRINELLLHHLSPWLNELAKDFDVEFVEIKGTLPVVEFNKDDFGVQRYKAGMAAKVPRCLYDDFEAFKNLHCLDITDCLKLPVQEKTIYVQPEEGSCTGKNFSEQLKELEEGGYLNETAKRFLNTHGSLKTSDRNLVTTEDLAIWLMLLEFFTNNMPANGGLPTARIAGMWSKLYADGDISRPWNSRKHKAIRDYLSDLGMIAWDDESYMAGHFVGETFFPGRCMKWCLSKVMMDQLEQVKVISPAKDKEEHALLIQDFTNLQKWITELEFCKNEDQIRPIEEVRLIKMYDPDQATAITGYYEAIPA